MIRQLIKPSVGLASALTALSLALVSNLAQAAQVTVSNDAGLPLKDAVVEVYYDTSTTSDLPQQHNIYQQNATFHPNVLAIPTDSYVSFPNQDNTRHHVYSFSPAKTFDLNLYLQETPPPIHFDQAGVVVLGCNIHDQMEAFIVVSDAPYVAITDTQGRLTLPELPPGEHRIRIWHPQMDDGQQTWWEGTITDADSLDVSVELNALPPQAPSLSPLQQRFRDAS